jgi:hypothetical protein
VLTWHQVRRTNTTLDRGYQKEVRKAKPKPKPDVNVSSKNKFLSVMALKLINNNDAADSYQDLSNYTTRGHEAEDRAAGDFDNED